MSSAVSDQNPYKGQLSYQVEDARLFFGREQEATQLTARILANRVTVLHAASGTGKTSLLNARIIPALEAQGWLPIVSQPRFHPVLEIRRDTLHTLFPPVEAELLALDEILRELGVERERGLTLGQLLRQFDEAVLPTDVRRRLLAPVENQQSTRVEEDARPSRAVRFRSTEGIMPELRESTPYLSRLLRRTIAITMVDAHFAAIVNTGLGADWEEGIVREDMDVATLREVLNDPTLVAAYRALVSWLDSAPAGLRPFFEQLMQSYGAALGPCGLVLILDQFEQIFTMFSGKPRMSSVASADSTGEVRSVLREQLFDELEHLYQPSPSGSEAAAGTELPIRYVLSLRDEWVGRLNRFRAFVSDFDSTNYRLNWLTVEAARDAIDGPAARAGRTLTTDCREAIISALATEDDLVEPGLLQLVCHGLWKHHIEVDGGALITLRSIGKRGVDGILRETFEQFFEGLSPVERVELLDMLAPLLTFNRTRNIVERRRLTGGEFRDPDLRQKLLVHLEHRRILRKEPRGNEVYYEITHEFLIDPILHELRTNLHYGNISRAIWALRSRLDGAVSQPLPEYIFRTLEEQKDNLSWTPTATEVMLQNAVLLDTSRETIRGWVRRYSDASISIDGVMSAEGVEGSRLLRHELEQIRGRLELVKTPDHATTVARNLIRRATQLDREEFRHAFTVIRSANG